MIYQSHKISQNIHMKTKGGNVSIKTKREGKRLTTLIMFDIKNKFFLKKKWVHVVRPILCSVKLLISNMSVKGRISYGLGHTNSPYNTDEKNGAIFMIKS